VAAQRMLTLSDAKADAYIHTKSWNMNARPLLQ
jgi:hypothetical protein